jgi:hypothetical protein
MENAKLGKNVKRAIAKKLLQRRARSGSMHPSLKERAQ